MAERAVFLDRDNTIIENDGYLGDPSKVKLMAGAAAALAGLRGLGYRLIVISNQSGVARGMFDEAAVESVNQEMSRQLKKKADAYIDASYYCPYHPDGVVPEYRTDHEWRKPKPGMLKQAAVDFGLDLAQCWMIGDQGRDITAGAAAGCRTILLRDIDHPSGAKNDTESHVSPNFVVRTLADATRIIAREGRHTPPAPHPSPHPAPAATAPEPRATITPSESAPQNYAPALAVASTIAAPATSQPAISPKMTISTEGDTNLPLSPGSAVDEEALAERIGQRLGRQMAATHMPATSRLEKDLDELVTQLRQQNRNADLRPDFTLSKFAAILLQAFALVALGLALANHFTAPATYTKPENFSLAQIAHLSSVMWAIVAIAFQAMVISLLLLARQK